MDTTNRFGPLLGRSFIALIFVLSGIGKVTGFNGVAGYIASKGFPMPELFTIGAIIVEIGCGAALILGWKPRLAAMVLFLFTALSAFLFHDFWEVPADQMQNQMNHFLKNVSMMGGLIYIATYGAGPLAVSAMRTFPIATTRQHHK
jgi:putative oxidoreductase